MFMRLGLLLFFSSFYSMASAQPADISIKQLLMSDSLLAERATVAGEERELRYFINLLETADYRPPEDWQQQAIRESTYRASSILNVSVIETQEKELADVVIYVAKQDQQDSLGGTIGVNMEIKVSHNSGKGNVEDEHDDLSKSTWRNIYLHELGHFLGLEHPWDKDDGDWAVNNWSDSHESTRMGYNEHLNGEYSWYSDLDIAALEFIWGKGQWLSYYSGVSPGQEYEVASNNIGIFDQNQSAIFSCLKLTTDGISTTLGGISEFDIRFNILSIEEGTIQVSANREFNLVNAKTSPLFINVENASVPDCVGNFENTTGVYTDLIKSGSNILNTTWNLIDSDNLIFQIESYQELDRR